MTYYKFRWPLFLILFVVCGYYLLHFFSRLTDINMFSAIVWGFQTRVSVGKGFPVWLFSFLAILFYPFLFTAFFVFLETPVNIFQMKNNSVGGLLGFRDGLKAHVYDPFRNSYIAYEHLNPPPTASKFTEAFKVVLLYKYRPSSKYYQDTRLLNLSSQLGTLLVAVVGLSMVYICLYGLAEAYIVENGLPIKLSYSFIVAQFQKITGIPAVKALLIALSVYAIVLGAGIFSVKMLINHYRDFYAPHQRALRNTLMSIVSPMDTITGTVIRRHTVEFRDLIQIPVYLNITTRPSKSAKEDEDRLDRLFPDEWEDNPKEMPELDFIVNPDYSISLNGNETQGG